MIVYIAIAGFTLMGVSWAARHVGKVYTAKAQMAEAWANLLN